MTDSECLEKSECRICGAQSRWEQGYVEVSNLRHGPHKVCITCEMYRRKYRRFFRGYALRLVIATYLFQVLTEDWLTGLSLTVASYFLFYAAVVLHECGHAIAARLVGFRLLVFSLGGGIYRSVFRIRDTFLQIGPSPVEGAIIATPKSRDHYRKKQATILIAGPAVNIVTFLVALWQFNALSDEAGIVTGLLWLVWLAANFMSALTLVPKTYSGPFGPQQSDGKQLIGLWKTPDEDIDEILNSVNLAYACMAYFYGSLESAYDAISDELANDRLSSSGKAVVSAVLIRLGRQQEAIDRARSWLASDEIEPEDRAILKNNIASALLDGPDGDLPEADQLSSEAMDFLPMSMPVRGTRGAVLARLGRYEEAIALLDDRRFRLEQRHTRSWVLAHLAIALAGTGDTKRARAALNKSGKLDASSEDYLRAKGVVESTSPLANQRESLDRWHPSS